MSKFARELHGKVAKPGENVVISPFSIAAAYAMARAGAAGQTGAQLDAIFGFPADGPHTAMNGLLQEAVTATDPKKGDDAKGPVVTVANGLFAQENLAIEKEFLKILAAQYGTGVHTVDFGSDDAKKAIDAWVSKNTNERIKELFGQLPASTRLVLANAVYFKARWLTPFAQMPKAPFARADGTAVQADMMTVNARGRFTQGADFQAAELPYVGRGYSMWVMLPKAGTDPGTMLTPDRLAALAKVPALAGPDTVAVTMPKWDFGTTIDLGGTVPGLSGGDYSGIVPGLTIDQAVHKANITVDENGTIAAAVTGLAMPLSAPPPPVASITLDRPFAFVIMHNETGLPLFVGSVADPTNVKR